jgi:hypothetical protein
MIQLFDFQTEGVETILAKFKTERVQCLGW